MSTGEDELSPGLNGRLRPRKSTATTASPQNKTIRKSECKHAPDRPKRTLTPSKASPSKHDDLAAKSDPSSSLLFLCPYCDRKFNVRQTASKHARRIHLSASKQDNFIKCLYCNHSNAEPNSIIKHMVDSHPNQYFACLDCHTRFPSTTELAEHKLNVCEKQKPPYRSKLRQKASAGTKKNPRKTHGDEKTNIQNENNQSIDDRGFNGIVISCELKPSEMHDAIDIEDKITTNLILPSSKRLGNSGMEKNAVIVLDDLQWNKRIPANFSFHNTDADQILSRLGVVHRSPRVGESRKDLIRMMDEPNEKFEKCFDTNFYSRVARNVQENLEKCLDGSFNFNPDINTIKTRKSKISVVINTAEGFPILLSHEQFSRNLFDGFIPRAMAPKHKWKWDTAENDKNVVMLLDQTKRDSHVNSCIVTLISSLDIWTQLRMKRKFEEIFKTASTGKKMEKQNILSMELKEILESRDIPSTSTPVVEHLRKPIAAGGESELPGYLGLSPTTSRCELQPAVLSGEWVRPRCYVCCACGEQTRDGRALTAHISTHHPNAQVQHYEIVGETLLSADILKHLYVPPSQISNRTRPPRGFRDCTKCKKSVTLEDLHQHMLDCAGDTPTVRRKCRYRPFGLRRRRPRLPDNTIRKKMRKDIRARHRQKVHLRPRPKIRTEVGDAETIRKMIADLPAKRNRITPSNVPRPRRNIIKSKNPVKIRTTDQKSKKADNVKKTNKAQKPQETKQQNDTDNSSNVDEDDQPLKLSTTRASTRSSNGNKPLRSRTTINRTKKKKQSNKKVATMYERNSNHLRSDHPHHEYYNMLPGTPPCNMCPPYYPCFLPNNLALQQEHINQMTAHQSHNMAVDAHQKRLIQAYYNQRIDLASAGPSNIRQHSNRSNYNMRGSKGAPRGGRGDRNQNNNMAQAPRVPLKHSIASLTSATKSRDASIPHRHYPYLLPSETNVAAHETSTNYQKFENEAVTEKIDKPPISHDPFDFSKHSQVHLKRNSEEYLLSGKEPLSKGYQESAGKPALCNDSTSTEKPGGPLASDSSGAQELIGPHLSLNESVKTTETHEQQQCLVDNPIELEKVGGQPFLPVHSVTSTNSDEQQCLVTDQLGVQESYGHQLLRNNSMISTKSDKGPPALNDTAKFQISDCQTTSTTQQDQPEGSTEPCIELSLSNNPRHLQNPDRQPYLSEPGIQQAVPNDPMECLTPCGHLTSDPEELIESCTQSCVQDMSNEPAPVEEHKDDEMKIETDKSKLNKTRKGLNDCIAMLITKKSLPRVRCSGKSCEEEVTAPDTIESECFDTHIGDFTTVATELCIRHRELLQESISGPFLTPTLKLNKAKCELARSNFCSPDEHDESLAAIPNHPRLINVGSGFLNMRRNTYDGMLITGDAEHNNYNVNNVTQKLNTLRDMNDPAFQSRGKCIKCIEESKQILNNKLAKPELAIEKIKHIDITKKDTKNIDTTTPRRTKRKPTKRRTAYSYPQNSLQIDIADKITAESPIHHDSNKNLGANSEDLNKQTASASIAVSPIKTRACSEDIINKHLATNLPAGLSKIEIPSNIISANSADMNKHLAKQLQEISTSIDISTIKTPLVSTVQRESCKQVLDVTKTNAVIIENRTNESQIKVLERSPELPCEETKSIQNIRRSSAELSHSIGHYKSSNYDNSMPQEYSECPLFNQGGFSNVHKTSPENEVMQTPRYSTLNDQHSHYSNAVSESVSMSQDIHGKAQVISMADKNNAVNTTMARMIQVNRPNFENEHYPLNPQCSNVQKQTSRNDKSESSTDNSSKDMRINPEFQAMPSILDNNFASCTSYGEYYARMSQYQNRFPNMYPRSFPEHSSDSYHKFHPGSFALPTITHPDKYKATSPMTFSLHESVEKLTPLDLSSDSTHYESCNKSSDVFKNHSDIRSNEIDYDASTAVNFRRNYSEKTRNQAPYPYLPSFKHSDDKTNKNLILESTPDMPQEKTKMKNINQEHKLTETQIDQSLVSSEPVNEIGEQEIPFSHSEKSFFTSNSSARFQEPLVNDWRDISPNHRNINQPISATASTHNSNSLQNMVYNPSQKCFYYNGDTVDTFNARNCSTDLLVSQSPESQHPHYLKASSDIPQHVNRQDRMHEKTFLENKKIGRSSLNPTNDVTPDVMYENIRKNKEFRASENHLVNRANIQNHVLETESDETKGQSCNQDMSDKDSMTIDQDPELARKIAMLPRELVEIIGTMPKDHRNQLLNVLPQYVSNPVSATEKDIANTPYMTVAQKSNAAQIEIKQTTGDLNKLSVNAAISPSSIIPKKRHSPSQSTCKLNFNENPPAIRASLTSTLSERTLMNNDNELTNKTKGQGYDRCALEKDGSSVIDPFSERDSDDADINVVDVGEQENKDKDMQISAAIPFYLPTCLPQDLANKPKTSEQTASLRAVRIKTTSARKSFSEEINKCGDEKYTNPAQIVSSSQYSYGNLIDFKHKNTKVIHDFDSDMLSLGSAGQHQIIKNNPEVEGNESMRLSRSYIMSDVKALPPKSNPQNCAFVAHDEIMGESLVDVAVVNVNKEHGHFLGRIEPTIFSCGENQKDMTVNKEMDLTDNEAKEESFDATSTSKPTNNDSNFDTKICNSHAMPEIESLEKINEHVLTEKKCAEVNEVKETLSQYTITYRNTQVILENKAIQEKNFTNPLIPIEREIQCTKTQSEASHEQSHEDDSDDDVSLAIIKLKQCNSSIVATNIKQPKHSVKPRHKKKRQSIVSQRRLNKKTSRAVDEREITQSKKLTEDVIINKKSTTEPSGIEMSFDNKDDLCPIQKKDKNKKNKILHGNTTTASDDKLTSKTYEVDVNKENNINKNLKIKKDDNGHEVIDNQLDENIDKNVMNESKNKPRINTECNWQSGDVKMTATTEVTNLSSVEDSNNLNVNDVKCDSFEESNLSYQREKYENNLSGISDESEVEKRDSTSAIGVRMKNNILSLKSIEIQDTDMINSNLENPDLNKMSTVSSKHSTKTISLKCDGSDLQLCSEVSEVNVLPLRRSRRGKSMYVDNSCSEDIKQAEQVEDINKKTPLTMKRLILSRVEKDKYRERTVLGIDIENPTLMNQTKNITDIEVTEVQCDKKGKPLKRKNSPHPRRKSKKTKPINTDTNSQEEENSDASNLNCASENNNSILRELPPNAEHKVDGKETQKDDENGEVIPDDAANLSNSQTLDAQENISEATCDNLEDCKESNSTGKRKLENTKVTDLVKCKSKKTKYQNNHSQSDFDTDDEKGLLETKIQKHLVKDNNSTTGISEIFPQVEDSHEKLSSSCDESNSDVHKQITNASMAVETRITCYNRPISNRRPRASSTTFKEQAHYDPYDIDFEDMIEIETTEPITKKKSRNASNLHSHKLHDDTKLTVESADAKIADSSLSKLSKQAASNVISIVNSESDSDSSKSDVPLQKYVNEKALELELKNKNMNINEIDHMRKKEPKSCKAKSDKTEITLDNMTCNTDSEEVNGISNSFVQNRRSSYKNKKQTKRVKKDDSLCESELLDKDQSIHLNKNTSVDQTTQKHQNKEKKSRRPAVTINVEPIIASLEIDQQLRSDKFMENFGFYSERIPRKSNLLASKKISETFHMISNESDDSFFGYKEKTTKKTTQNEHKKKCETSMDSVISQDSRAMPNDGSSVSIIQSNLSRVNVSEGVGEPLIAHEPYDVAKTDDGDFDSLLAQSIFDSEEVRNLENDLIAGFKEAALAKAARNSHVKIHELTDTFENSGQTVDSPIKTFHLEEDLYKIDDNSESINKVNNIKLIKQAGVKDMVYPDIEDGIHKTYNNPKSVKNKSKPIKLADKDMMYLAIEEDVRKINNDPELEKTINKFKANTHVGVKDMVCPDIEEEFHRIDDNPGAVKKINKSKPNKQPGVKDMMYPEIEEIDMLEDKFDKIKRKRRSQAVAAKQIQSAVEASTSAKPRKQTEKKRATKSLKKGGQSAQVPTKGALKGFDGIKISIPTHDLIMPPSVSPPRQQKRRKKVSTKPRKAPSDSESSCSEIDEGDKCGVVDKDIYEFKDSEDTELLELRPSTVMDRFRSMHNKTKLKQKEKDKGKGDIEKDKQKSKERDKKIDVKEMLGEDKEKIKEVKQHHPTESVKRRKRHKSIETELTSLEKKIENVKHKFKKLDERINLNRPHQTTEQDVEQGKNMQLKKYTASEQPQYCDDDNNKKEVDNAIPSTSGYIPDVPDRIQESDYESELSSPEENFIVYNNIPDDANCVCPSDNDTDDSDVEKGCGKSNCIYKNINADKNAAIGNIFKNNAVRCEKLETKEPEVPRPNLDQLFDSLFETNPNNSELSGNLNEFTQTQTLETLAPSPQTSVNHERNTCTDKFYYDFQITSKGNQPATSDKEILSRLNDSSSECSYNHTLTKNKTEKTYIQTHEMHSTKYGDTSPLSQNETMSDFNSFYNFPADDKPKEKLGFSLMSEECTQVNLEDIIADEDLVRNKGSGKDAINNEYLKVPCRSADYNSEDEFDIDKPEPAKKQYMHLILPAEKTSCYAQTEPKSDHSDNECCNQLAASKYLKGVSPVETGKGETYTILSKQSPHTEKSNDDSSIQKDFSEIKSEQEAPSVECSDMRVVPRSRVRLQKYDSDIDQKSNISKSMQTEKTKSCKYDAQYEINDDDDIKKRDVRALKAPDSLKSNVKNDKASHTVFDEDNEMSPPVNAKAFAAPASRLTVEKHSPRRSDEGISTSHDYSADALDQSYDDTGVACQRARRKCTVGKQNILAEHWSSESEFDGRPVRPNSADSVVVSARKKKSRKKEYHSGGRRGRNASKGERKGVRGRARSGGRSDDSDACAGPSRAPPGPKIRARPAHHYWSSDGEEASGPQPQHGWIVGDSHKKLVTMLAHAKGRKRHNADKRHLFD